MRFLLSIFLFAQVSLFAIQTDFDVAIVGTSPISMLEAIYHLARNERVLILEADERCGGAWKSIDVCGITNADLGCHQIGSDEMVKDFFETYFGCEFICLNHPNYEPIGAHSHCSNGFYFSGGCQELIAPLKKKIDSYPNACMVHHSLESIFVDRGKEFVELSFGDTRCTTAKLTMTSGSYFKVTNPGYVNKDVNPRDYHHLYVLVEDDTPASFTYLPGIVSGMTRAMNLTSILQNVAENLQLIVFQVQMPKHLSDVAIFLEALKTKGFLSAGAKIIDSSIYTYKQVSMQTSALQKLAGPLVEVLNAGSFSELIGQIDKWKSAMTPLENIPLRSR